MGNLDIPVTAAGTPIDEIAKGIVNALMNQIDGLQEEEEQSVSVEIVERESCSHYSEA